MYITYYFSFFFLGLISLPTWTPYYNGSLSNSNIWQPRICLRVKACFFVGFSFVLSLFSCMMLLLINGERTLLYIYINNKALLLTFSASHLGGGDIELMTSHCAWFCLFLRASPDHNNRRKARKKKGKICYSFPSSSIRHINSVLKIRTGKKNLKERERES